MGQIRLLDTCDDVVAALGGKAKTVELLNTRHNPCDLNKLLGYLRAGAFPAKYHALCIAELAKVNCSASCRLWRQVEKAAPKKRAA